MWPQLLRLAVAGIAFGFIIWFSKQGSNNQHRQSNRHRREPSREPTRRKRNSTNLKGAEQRKQLEDHLKNEIIECIICTEKLYKSSKVWPCRNCWNIFHLHCITKWATTNESNRCCPCCRNSIHASSLEYSCMCGRVNEPKFIDGITPHCCGRKCQKCESTCHPGSCSD